MDLILLGIHLGIDDSFITSYKENNQNLSLAMFDLLYRYWYKAQDAYQLQNEGLDQLCEVLRHPNVRHNLLVGTVIDKHFNRIHGR